MSEDGGGEPPRSRPRFGKGARGASPRAHTYVEKEEENVEIDHLKLAGFRVGGGVYAIDIMRIKEVIQAGPHPIRRVPHAPDIVEGVIALRGVVIPVIDLRKRFGVAIDPAVVRFNKLIIVSARGRIVGLVVDRILGELRVPSNAVRPAPSLLRPAGRDEFFAGVCRKDDEMVFVINLETVIDPSVSGTTAGSGVSESQASGTASPERVVEREEA